MRRILLCLFVLIGLCGCASPEEVRSETFYTYFDTVSVIYSYAGDSEEDFRENCRNTEAILYRYDQLLSAFENDCPNGLYALNEAAGKEVLEIDQELMDFLLYAEEIYELTDHKVNVMSGALTMLWKEQIESDHPVLPAENDISWAMEHSSMDALVLDTERRTAYITDPDARIDAGALGKGYVCRLLQDQLPQGYAISLGGNITAIGTKKSGESWSAGIMDPRHRDQVILKLKLQDCSLVTSGDYERYFDLDGIRYHHIIDPDTGYPSHDFSSVTILSKNPALADALSTALFLMPYERGCTLIEELPDTEAVWIRSDGTQYMSSAFRTFLTK